MRRLASLAAAPALIVVLGVAWLGTPAAVGAACPYSLVGIRAALPSAKQVFIGDVTRVADAAANGYGSRFTVLVRYVVRGRVHRWPMAITDIRSARCAPLLAGAARVRDWRDNPPMDSGTAISMAVLFAVVAAAAAAVFWPRRGDAGPARYATALAIAGIGLALWIWSVGPFDVQTLAPVSALAGVTGVVWRVFIQVMRS